MLSPLFQLGVVGRCSLDAYQAGRGFSGTDSSAGLVGIPFDLTSSGHRSAFSER
jgi:hypothetical protein